MRTKVYLSIAFRVLMLFSIGFAMSYMKPYLHDFLCDTVHVCESQYCGHGVFIDDGYDWGAPHFWYFWCMFFLFILSAINCFVSIRKILIKEYPNTF